MKTGYVYGGLLSLGLFMTAVWAEKTPKYPEMNEVDEFAKVILNKAQKLSFANDKEHCGLIGFNGDDELVATEPMAGDADGCQPAVEPDDFEVIASYHTHGSYSADADTEAPSPDDLVADFAENIDGYISTPGGRFWLNLLELRETVMLCGPGCLIADPDYKPCPSLLPKASYTLPELRRREMEDNGQC